MEKESHPKVFVEPVEKVVETLKLAVVRVGVKGFSQRVRTSQELIEDWVSSKSWVPIAVLRAACEINKEFPDAPPYTKNLSKCIEGVQLRIPPEELELESKPIIAEATEELTSHKGLEQREKPFSSYRILIFSTFLCSIIFILSVIGYIVGRSYGILYAGAGLFIGIILGLGLTIFLIFKLKHFLV